MKTNVTTLGLLTLTIIFSFACTKENTQNSDIQINNTELSVIEAGIVHNTVCKSLLKETQQYKNDGLTIMMFDSIFLTMYPEFTQTDLDSYKTIIKKTRTKSTTEIYDSIRSNIDYDERAMYLALDSLLLSYKNNNDLNLVISELELLFSVIESDQTMDAIFKYCGLSTINVSKSSIELWSNVMVEDGKYLNMTPDAIISDINTYHNITQGYLDAGYSGNAIYRNRKRIATAAAYASACTYLDIEITGTYNF